MKGPVCAIQGYTWLAHRSSQRATSQVSRVCSRYPLPPKPEVTRKEVLFHQINSTASHGRSSCSATEPVVLESEHDIPSLVRSPWEDFLYTVTDWLLPDGTSNRILKFQPVNKTSNDDWTTDFEEVIRWWRSDQKKNIARSSPVNPSLL